MIDPKEWQCVYDAVAIIRNHYNESDRIYLPKDLQEFVKRDSRFILSDDGTEVICQIKLTQEEYEKICQHHQLGHHITSTLSTQFWTEL